MTGSTNLSPLPVGGTQQPLDPTVRLIRKDAAARSTVNVSPPSNSMSDSQLAASLSPEEQTDGCQIYLSLIADSSSHSTHTSTRSARSQPISSDLVSLYLQGTTQPSDTPA